MGHVKQSIHIDAPVEKVVEYSGSPNNWPKFMEGMSDPSITGDRGVGQQVEFTMLLAGIRGHETVRTLEDRIGPDGSGHWRAELTGTASGWEIWDLEPEEGGTLLTLEMEYTVRGSVLGKMADRLFLGRMMDRDMLRSLEKLKLLMEAAPAVRA